MTAKEWKDKNPNLEGNMRDYANILQLVILVNLENLNAEMIEQGIEQSSISPFSIFYFKLFTKREKKYMIIMVIYKKICGE